ncbi:MAG: hypothetical protein V4560_04720 [Bacteroidota bacterium]
MNNKIKNSLIGGIIIISLVYLFLGLIFRPIVCNDAINGMLSLHNHLQGTGWNKVLILSSNGLGVKEAQLTWWAPGQYQIPYLLSKIFSISIGTAIIIILFVALCSGSFFYYKLFKLSGLKPEIVLCAILILLLQRFVNIFFIEYNSCDLFLFFFTPFYIYTYYTLIKNYRNQLVLKLILLTALNTLGLFIKNSFILFELAFNVFLIVEYFFDNYTKPMYQRPGKFILPARLLTLLPLLVANLLNYYFFLRLGETPTKSYGLLLTVSNILTGIFAPVMEILFGSLSLSGIYGSFYDKITLSPSMLSVGIVVILLMIGYALYLKKAEMLNSFKKDRLYRLICVLAIMYIMFWFVFIVKQCAISNEDRLFLPMSILVFPYILNSVITTKNIIKYGYIGLVFFSIAYGMLTFVYRIKTRSQNGSLISKNPNLNGFKLYNVDGTSQAQLDSISKFISYKFAKDYIILSNPEIAFGLNLANKFILTNTSVVPDLQQIHYLVLVKIGRDIPPTGFKQVYSIAKFAIYKPDNN